MTDGETVGAVYTAMFGPLARTVPSAELPLEIPFTSHAMVALGERQNVAVSLRE